ncbi:MAG: hypothetical protein K0Q48_685 [Bacillota bacterium]|nr:hypothetical protein [Bacillota bacterium]
MIDNKLRRLLYLQDNENKAVDDIISIINHEDSLLVIAMCAYHLGLINGKREERAKHK